MKRGRPRTLERDANGRIPGRNGESTSVYLDYDLLDLIASTGQGLAYLIERGCHAHLAFDGSMPAMATPAEVEVEVRDSDGRLYGGRCVLVRR